MENLLDPKCYCSLNDQETIDKNKSSNLFDNNYDILLGNLDLSSEPSLLKKINKSSFSYDDFL